MGESPFSRDTLSLDEVSMTARIRPAARLAGAALPSGLGRIALFALAGVSLSHAAMGETRTLYVFHQGPPRASWIADSSRLAPELTKAKVNDFDLRPGDTVFFKVGDPNPLVFDYKASEVTNTPTADFEAVQRFAEALGKIGPLLGPRPGGGGPEAAAGKAEDGTNEVCPGSPVAVQVKVDALLEPFVVCEVDSLDLVAAKRGVADLQSAFASIPGVIRASLTKDGGVRISDTSRWPQFGDSVAAALKKAAAIEHACGLTGTQTVGARVSSSTRGGSQQIDVPCNAAAVPGFWTIEQYADKLIKVREPLLEMARVLREIDEQRQVTDLDLKTPDGASVAIAYDARVDQALSVTVARTKRYDAILSKEDVAHIETSIRDRVGEYKFAFHPRTLAHFKMAGGVVYSFVNVPKYSTAKQGDDLVVAVSSEDFAAYDAAIMLNVIPAAWSDPSFSPYFQVGVTPRKDQVAFYFGAGLSGFSRFNFGLGLTLLQVQKLEDGLTVGAKLQKPEDLKLSTRFKTGLYVQLTVTP